MPHKGIKCLKMPQERSFRYLSGACPFLQPNFCNVEPVSCLLVLSEY